MESSPTALGRILLTTDAVGGVWTYTLSLARALADSGVEIALACLGPAPSAAQRRQLTGLPHVTLHENTEPLEWMDDPWSGVDRAGEWLLNVAADFSPDVVHLNKYAHGALPWPVPVLVAAHSCVCSWWSAVRGGTPPPVFDEYRRRVNAGLAAADLVVAPSAAMLGALGEHYGRLAQKRVIPNAANPAEWHTGVKRPRIFAAGRAWDEAKNLAALDAIAPRIKWPIRLAGDTRKNCVEAREFPHLQCLGKLGAAQMRAECAAAAIYALPARYEPFGLSALEAGLSGCALVLGDIPSLREVWGDAALFVAPDDQDSLAQTLDGLISDARRRAEFARRARARALKFAPDTMAERYLAAYRFCLAGRQEEVAA